MIGSVYKGFVERKPLRFISLKGKNCLPLWCLLHSKKLVDHTQYTIALKNYKLGSYDLTDKIHGTAIRYQKQ